MKTTPSQMNAYISALQCDIPLVCIKNGECAGYAFIRDGMLISRYVKCEEHPATEREIRFTIERIFYDAQDVVPGYYDKRVMNYRDLGNTYGVQDMSLTHPNAFGL